MNWTWGIAALSLVGTVANIKMRKWCFVIWLFTNGAWCLYSIITKQYSRGLLDFIYLLFAIYGLKEWSKDKRSNHDRKSKSETPR